MPSSESRARPAHRLEGRTLAVEQRGGFPEKQPKECSPRLSISSLHDSGHARAHALHELESDGGLDVSAQKSVSRLRQRALDDLSQVIQAIGEGRRMGVSWFVRSSLTLRCSHGHGRLKQELSCRTRAERSGEGDACLSTTSALSTMRSASSTPPSNVTAFLPFRRRDFLSSSSRNSDLRSGAAVVFDDCSGAWPTPLVRF
jgi:hypothetical protein